MIRRAPARARMGAAFLVVVSAFAIAPQAASAAPLLGARTDYGSGPNPWGVAGADFDGDGNRDLAVADSGFNTVSVLLGDGNGGFGAKTDFAAGVFPVSVAGEDFNGDGNPDLAVANAASNTVSVLLGDGNGGFGANTDFATGATPWSVTSADFNGDGNPDLAVANLNSNTVSVLLGDGNGGFGARSNYFSGGRPWSVTSADFNGDGNPDVAVTNSNSNTVSVLLGDGNGGFGAKTDFATSINPQSVTSADFDADGNPDLAVVSTDDDTISVLLGDGNGGFGAKTDFATGPDPQSLTSEDIDGDGDPDLAVVNQASNTLSVLLGDGNGGFGAKTDFGTGASPYSVIGGDFDGDGSPDLAVTNFASDTVSVLLANSNPRFGAKTDFTTGVGSQSIAGDDFDADGNADLAVANYGSNTVSILLGNGNGGLGPKTDIAGLSSPRSVASDDFDGDGSADLAVARDGSNAVSILLGDGHGGFGAKTDFTTGSVPVSVTSEDFNGDGDPDLAVANFGSNTVSILLGNGSGGFGSKTDFATGTNPLSVRSEDFDGDGNADLAVANFGSNSVSILLGNGNGGFGPKTDFATGSAPYSVASEDLNGDGDADLAVANNNSNTVSILLGNGSGGFGSKTDFATGGGPRSVTIEDLNGDGNPDLAVANFSSNTVSVLLGNGGGGFGPKTDFTAGNGPRFLISAALSNDGRPDLAVANFNANNVSVLLNAGTPTTYPTERSLRFGRRSAPATRTLTIRNGGSAKLHIGSASIDGADASAFEIASDHCSGQTVLVHQGCEITVRFATASASSFKRASLLLPSNAPDSPLRIPLSGFHVDQPPTAVNDSKTLDEDAAATTINVLANDTDPDGGPKTIASKTNGSHGQVAITNSGADLTYTPDANNYCGSDSFTYALNGGSQATVSVTVTCVNDAPSGTDNTATINEDGSRSFTAADFGFSDPDDTPADDLASVTISTLPSPGSLKLSGSSVSAGQSVNASDLANLTYAPAPDGCGTGYASFTFKVADDGGTSNGGIDTDPTANTFTFDVTCVDDPPTAVDDSKTLDEDAAAATIDVLANDTDPDSGPKTIASKTNGSHGTVAITNSGADLTYTPDSNYCGSDTFTYTLNGGSTATVSVTVTCVDDPPSAVNDSKTLAEDAAATTIDVLANDTDPDGGPKTIQSKTNGSHGSVAITNSGADLTYTPDSNYCGSDTFTYTLNGGSTATVSVTVSCVDDPPHAVDDSKTLAEDSAATTIDVLANDTDNDSGPKAVQSKTNGSHGQVAVTNSGADLTYTPDADYCGSDTFTYALNGGSTATVSVTVTCVDDLPSAVNDSKTLAEDAAATTIDVLANDTDPDGGPKTIQSKTNGAHGTVAITSAGADLTYTPDAGYCGSDSFTYTLNGGSTATVSITVACKQTGPDATASAPAKQTIHGKKVQISVDLAADSDVHVVISGKCEPEGSRKSLALKRQDVDLKAGETLTLKLIPKKNPGLIHRALERGRKVTAQVTIRFYGADGSVKLQTLKVRLK